MFKELTDKQWGMIKQHVPPPAKTGRPRSDDRKIINGIMFVLTIGCRWDDIPKRYGDDSTANLRLRRWQQFRVWKEILACAIKPAHRQNKLNLQKISVGSTTIPAKKGET